MKPDLEHVQAFLAKSGLPTSFKIVDIPGGGNNQVYCLDLGVRRALLKAYFRDKLDTRDRLGAEFSFISFLWENGVRKIPQPLGRDDSFGLGLYEYIEGGPLRNGEVDKSAVDQAMSFFRELNACKLLPSAGQLRPGSEACFTMAEHLDCVDRRMKRFDQLDRATPTGEEAAVLAFERLIPVWNRIRAGVVGNCAVIDEPLALRDRCLSPSDFGFHNTIADAARNLKFIDFEYAGWDDPAKTCCDFFCQPDVTVPLEFFDAVSRAFVDGTSDPEKHLRRIDLLLPVYRVKWCCIMLNDFLPAGSRRRSFAKDPSAQEQRRIAQLRKVRLALDAISG
jgi:hypothetical protein